PEDVAELEAAEVWTLFDAERLDAAEARAREVLGRRGVERLPALTLVPLRAALRRGDRAALRAWFADTAAKLPVETAAEGWRLVAERFRAVPSDAGYAELLDAALARNPDDAAATFWRADLALLRRRDAEALALFRRYRALRPDEGLARATVAFAEARNGLLADAEASLEAATASNAPPDAIVGALRELVGAHHAAKRYADAARLQRRVAERTQTPPDALDLGVLLLDAGDPNAAAEAYRATLARDDLDRPTRAKAWNSLGLLHRGRGEAADAERCLRASIAAWEDALDGRENLGVLLVDLGRGAEAREHFEACLARDPERKRSLYYLLRLLRPETDGAGG
ncbi:MAG TPA: tetratricopeptide repeat protein, partial [Planctomycetota bacterium]|nr:tetratricopeptide repeat protein [Planctomycetota bacterium]